MIYYVTFLRCGFGRSNGCIGQLFARLPFSIWVCVWSLVFCLYMYCQYLVFALYVYTHSEYVLLSGSYRYCLNGPEALVLKRSGWTIPDDHPLAELISREYSGLSPVDAFNVNMVQYAIGNVNPFTGEICPITAAQSENDMVVDLQHQPWVYDFDRLAQEIPVLKTVVCK